MTAPYPHQPPYGPPQQQPYGPQNYGAYPGQYYGGQPPMPQREVTRSRKRTSHGLHLFLTIITFGMWGLLVWLPITLWHKMGPRQKTVTKWS